MRSAKDFLPGQTASQLAQRLALHQRLLATARRALPTYLQNHCQSCWLNRRGQLVLQVDGQEYAAQIRFFLVAIQEALAKAVGVEITQVLLRAAIPAASAPAPSAAATPAAARLIAQEAVGAPVQEIGEALSRLAASMAGRCRKKNKEETG